MKKTILLLLIIISQSGNAQFWIKKEKLSGNGEVVTESRRMPVYDKLSVTGPFRVEIVQGKLPEVKVTTDENLMQAIDIFVKGGRLTIRTHPDFQIEDYTRMHILVPAEYLSDIKLTGSGNITAEYVFNWNNLKLSITGSGEMNFETNMKNISVSVTGSGEAKLQGQTDKLKISITGSGEVDARKLEARTAEVTITGSGNAYIKASAKLVAKIFGAGYVYYYEEPDNLKTKILGSGEVIFKR